MTTSVVVHPDPTSLAEAAAARLVTLLRDVQGTRGMAHLVLTGGGIGIATLTALAENPDHRVVDWESIHLWWGDERFLPEGDPERNVAQARAALLNRVPVPASAVHPMPASDGPDGDDVDAAARRYTDELASFTDGRSGPPDVPAFDVVLLGVGPDGHVASLFPGSTPLAEQNRSVVAVRNSPKPPPTRLSLTVPALCRARQIWLLAAGVEKRRAISEALGDGSGLTLPAGRVHGREQTMWLVDTDAAALVPTRILRPEIPPS